MAGRRAVALTSRDAEASPEASPRSSLSWFSLLLMTVIVAAILLYEAQFDVTVRWALGIVAIAVVTALAWFQVHRRATEPAPLEAGTPRSAWTPGPLADLSAAVHRAHEGLAYSQAAVAGRARAAFATRVRLARGLSEEEMRGLQPDPAAMRSLVGDAVLADFLAVDESNRDDRERWAREAEEGSGFSPAFEDVLRRMEDWQ